MIWKLLNRKNHSNESYAQEGEDILLLRYLEGQRQGFYVDVGAHHPKRFSNTYLLYKRGWKGINIEPTPGKKALFEKERPLDINLDFAVGLHEEVKTFYVFNESALNTFNTDTKHEVEKLQQYALQDNIQVQVFPLAKILDKYFPKQSSFDLLTIDVEGNDLEVLKSNDWQKYRPRFILVEGKYDDLASAIHSPIVQFLGNHGYIARAKTYNTLLFS